MDKDALLKRRLPEGEAEMPGVGTVRVRGLSRAEAAAWYEVEGNAAKECRLLALCMVDPRLTEAEAAEWYAASPATEMQPVIDRILELSGMAETSEKAAYKSVSGEPDA